MFLLTFILKISHCVALRFKATVKKKMQCTGIHLQLMEIVFQNTYHRIN